MLVSILVPVYKGANFLHNLIRNVQAQTYPNFELILIDDASPDHSAEIVGQFNDPRIKYVRHEINKGADESRKTGLEISRGEIISFLDQDDLFHPDKLNEHVKLFLRDPSLGVAYNSRFVINESPESIYGQWCAPSELTLADLVLGYPFAPSDMTIRREWALRSDIWDASFAEQGDEIIVNGGEIVFFGRLYLAGCRFASLPRALNYRRYHVGRVLSDLELRCRSELRCQEIILEDPRCPASVSSLRNVAYMNTYVGFASLAFYQGEFDFGYDCLRRAGACQPDILRGFPAPVVQSLVERSIPDNSQDGEKILQAIFSQLPPDLSHLSTQQEWALGRTHLLQGIKSILWGRDIDGAQHLGRARDLHADFDKAYRGQLTQQLLNYESEFGESATDAILLRLKPFLAWFGATRVVRDFTGHFLVNRAFQKFSNKKYSDVLLLVLKAIWQAPWFMLNRGVVSIFLRSMVAGVRGG